MSSEIRLIKKFFDDYGSFHQTKENKLTHIFGIPVIVMSVLGLLHMVNLYSVSFFGNNITLTLGNLVFVAGIIFYLRLNILLGLSMIATVGLLYFLGSLMPWYALVAIFILGWIIQIIGHVKYEHKAPAFTKNLVHLLIGPIFIQNYLFKIWRDEP